MKLVLVILLSAAFGGLCGFFVAEKRNTARQQAEVQSLKASLDKKDVEMRELVERQERAEARSRQIAQLSDDVAAQARAREVALSNAIATRAAALSAGGHGDAGGNTGGSNQNAGSGFGKMLGEMMKDPEMRKLMKEQQMMAMEKMYAPLMKKMNLTPEETKQFNDLLGNRMDSGLSMAEAMFGGGATNRAELMQTVKVQNQAEEEKMKALLGEDRFAVYQDYQLTMGERAQLTQFRQQFSGDYNITDDQAERLLAVMGEEKKKSAVASGNPAAGQDPNNMEALLKDGQLEKLLEAQEQVNQSVYARAGEILSASQLSSFARFQTNQMQTMRMGMSMARKMLGSQGGTGTQN